MRHCIEIQEVGHDYGPDAAKYLPPGSITEQLDALVKSGARVEYIGNRRTSHDTSGPQYAVAVHVVYETEDEKETKA